jgi:hypothetical protein
MNSFSFAFCVYSPLGHIGDSQCIAKGAKKVEGRRDVWANGCQLACYASRASKARKGTIASLRLGRLEDGGSPRNGFFVRHLKNTVKYGIHLKDKSN